MYKTLKLHPRPIICTCIYSYICHIPWSSRLLYIEKVVVCVAAHLSSARPVPHCLYSQTFRLRCAPHIPEPQDKLCWLRVAEEQLPLAPVIAPPAWPCLYLKVQQEFHTWTPFLFDKKNDEQSCLLVGQACNSFNGQNRVTLSTDRSVWCAAWGSVPLDTVQLRAPCMERDVRSSMLFTLSFCC